MQLPFDGNTRRRLYLVRHGEAGLPEGEERSDVYGDDIPLKPAGIAEAGAMRDLLRDVPFGAAYCSDVRRAQETAAIVLEGRGLPLIVSERYTEVRGDFSSIFAAEEPPEQKLRRFAYSMWEADAPGARFFGGDVIADYIANAGAALTALVREHEEDRILIVSHSGFQRAALCWALDASPIGMAAFEQDSCCLNILDIDIAPDGRLVRKHVRLANYTPGDPAKMATMLTDGEGKALRFTEERARAAARTD